jgi:3-oxoacyl-[acyl-carrier-protein] synthase-3
MSIFHINDIAIKGIAASVPALTESNLEYDWISVEERMLLIKTTGVLNRRISASNSLASDLCFAAAQKILSASDTDASEIGILIFVSQSKDYILPSTAIILQDKLGLPTTSIAFDVPLGCSGYVYGLSIIASLMNNAKIKKGLLLTGDTSSLSLNWKDKSAYPLFGDAGSATLLEYQENSRMDFNLQTDGSNYGAIIIPHGGSRRPVDNESDVEQEFEKGIIRKQKNLSLNGFDVFNFSIKEVPPNIKKLLEEYKYNIDQIDYFVMHQANLLLNETIRKKLKIHADKVPYSLRDFGNTSSASIPLTMVTNLKNELTTKKKRILLSGFGVGLSWGSVILDTVNLIIPDIIEL